MLRDTPYHEVSLSSFPSSFFSDYFQVVAQVGAHIAVDPRRIQLTALNPEHNTPFHAPVRIFTDLMLWGILLSFIVLFCFVLFCFVLFCFVLFCFVLFCFVLFCFVLFCFVLFCFVLFCFVLIHCTFYLISTDMLLHSPTQIRSKVLFFEILEITVCIFFLIFISLFISSNVLYFLFVFV